MNTFVAVREIETLGVEELTSKTFDFVMDLFETTHVEATASASFPEETFFDAISQFNEDKYLQRYLNSNAINLQTSTHPVKCLSMMSENGKKVRNLFFR